MGATIQKERNDIWVLQISGALRKEDFPPNRLADAHAWLG